jgi:urea transport system permease protein
MPRSRGRIRLSESLVSEMNATDFSAALSNSLSLGSILILTALGLAITFGVMKVINMAHGEFVMLGAYTAVVCTSRNYLGYYLGQDFGIFIALPAAFLFVGFVGWLLEVCLIRFLYGRPLDTLLATWGVGMVIQQIVLLAFGANLEAMSQPAILDGNLEVGNVSIPYYRFFVVAICILCLFLVYAWFFWTSFGLKIRAVVQNRSMASACGISTRWVDSLTFAFASGLAGVAGVIVAHLYTIKYNMGADYIVEAFMVVILGGLGKLVGTVGAGTLIGFAKGFFAKYLPILATWEDIPNFFKSVFKFFGNEMMAQFLVLAAVIAFLIVRPQGLFTTKERSYE